MGQHSCNTLFIPLVPWPLCTQKQRSSCYKTISHQTGMKLEQLNYFQPHQHCALIPAPFRTSVSGFISCCGQQNTVQQRKIGLEHGVSPLAWKAASTSCPQQSCGTCIILGPNLPEKELPSSACEGRRDVIGTSVHPYVCYRNTYNTHVVEVCYRLPQHKCFHPETTTLPSTGINQLLYRLVIGLANTIYCDNHSCYQFDSSPTQYFESAVHQCSNQTHLFSMLITPCLYLSTWIFSVLCQSFPLCSLHFDYCSF